MKNELKQPLYTFITANISEINEEMCTKRFNRKGTLCGDCKEGFFPLVYSIDMMCVKCPNGESNWWKFLLVAFLPLTCFYLIVLCCKINITSSYFHGFIYYSQTISMPIMARNVHFVFQERPMFMKVARILLAFFGIWNLDFFRSLNLGICLKIDTLQMVALDLAVGVYLLFLIILTYVLINTCKFSEFILKPFRTIFHKLRTKTSAIDAFATFFLLSNVKFISISCDLLVPVHVFQLSSTGNLTSTWRVLTDPAVPYLGERHLPYAILGIGVLTLFVLLPVLLLTLYPFQCFQKFLNLFNVRYTLLWTHSKAGTRMEQNRARVIVDCLLLFSSLHVSSLLLLLPLFDIQHTSPSARCI